MTEQLTVTSPSDTADALLSVRDLRVSFPSEAGRVDAVRGVSFDIHRGRTLGIVGESGSGKSVTSMAVMGLLPDYAAVTGEVAMGGTDLLTLDDKKMSAVRGRRIGMIFQDPLSSLTPIFSVGRQIVEALQVHQDISGPAAWKRAVELLDLVGIPQPDKRVKAFPHEFSGGMRQRVVIAIAIANDPDLIIADEPTTALDVTVQAQILDVLKTAQRETGAAVIMITHDLGVVAGSADDVMVMYAGRARREGAGGRAVHTSPDALHPRAHGCDPPARPDRGRSCAGEGHPAAAGGPARRVPVRGALPRRTACLPHRRAGAGDALLVRTGRGAPGGLPARGRDHRGRHDRRRTGLPGPRRQAERPRAASA